MALVRAMVSFPTVAADTEDVVVNVWGFDMDPDEGTANSVANALSAFYATIKANLSPLQAWSTGTIKMYNLEEPEPREPFKEALFAPSGTVGTNSQAAEVCCCVSFQGDPVSGFPMRRRRGRIYIGPLAGNAINTSTGLLNSTLVAQAVTASQALEAASTSAASWTWGVISETPSLNFVRITNGWVDNAPDIQRRRGIDASLRTEWG